MSAKRKTFMIAVAALVFTYLLTPFVAGLIATYDRRGPKIFWIEHHELFYMFGYYLAGHQYQDGKPRVPLRERAWFYGMEGKPLDLDKKMHELENAAQARGTTNTGN
jgi:hypothetical protein